MNVHVTTHALRRFTERILGTATWPWRRLRPVYAEAVRRGIRIDRHRDLVLVLVSINGDDVCEDGEGMTVAAVARCEELPGGDLRVVTTTKDARRLSAADAPHGRWEGL